jgi:NADPH:quinone reductase-like Zn-dependent oxidoreductase
MVLQQTPDFSSGLGSVVQVREDATHFGEIPQGSVRVRTLCSALNHLDLWVVKGVPGLKLTYPRIGGSDACGLIEALGQGVDPSWLGKKVILNGAVMVPDRPLPASPTSPIVPEYQVIGEHTFGTHADAFIAPIANLQAIDQTADPVAAAAFGLTHLTAFSMLVGKAGLKSGQHVLITGIGGGVALAALAICKHYGCITTVTSRHVWKLEKAKKLGADHAILDEGSDWSRAARATTGGRGFDIAVDSSGKATHLACIKALARGGAYVTPGCTSGPDATTDLARIFWNQLRIIGSTMGSNDEFAQLAALYRKGVFQPVVHKVFDAADAALAYQELASGEQFGKVVIRWNHQ